MSFFFDFCRTNQYLMNRIILLISLSLLFFQCKKEEKSLKENIPKTSSKIKYAKGFDIISDGNQQKLIIKKTFYNNTDSIVFFISDKSNISKNEIKVPVEKLVTTSTTHVPMLELLGSENKLIGFPDTKYVCSKKTRKLIRAF